MRKCAIIAGGDMPDKEQYKNADYWERFGCIICADSGYYTAKKLGIKPDILTGDFDSFTEELPKGVEIIASIPEKDDTDTLMAVKKAIELGYKDIALFGALGGSRIEHTIANIQTMIYAVQQGCDLKIYGDSILMVQTADDGEVSYKSRGESLYMSVFALSDSIGIDYLRGVKYPLEDYLMVQSFPIGVSNEITDEAALLRINHGLALIILTDKK
ncbi:MAG: thiamine diphosphokinase [Ruminococcus sp.]|uniref:thiamine diphosphokinase n=1 Tax=Ruminococcus sp. TaxID=41978 RepID=UPI0025E05652|nr:thiamine diphosphokinase [Ruminococcus sp.]MBR5684441.1 thiamine diphosphokinase [Ruminococcus sp.]